MIAALADLSGAVSGLVATVVDRIVGIETGRGRRTSGLVFAEDLIVTAEEALPDDGDINVTFADGRRVKAEIVGRDPSTDVALLKAATGPAESWPFASTPPVGAMIVVIGRGEFSPLAALGTISETGPAWTSLHGGRIDARIHLAIRLSSRAEGGAILAHDGSLVGMAVSGPRHTVLAVPGTTIERAVAALKDKGYVARGFLGVSLQRLNRNGPHAGLIVADVEDGAPAAAAGLVVGDIITTWGGEPVDSVGDVARRLGAESIGSMIKLGVLRAGEPTERSLTVGKRPMTH